MLSCPRPLSSRMPGFAGENSTVTVACSFHTFRTDSQSSPTAPADSASSATARVDSQSSSGGRSIDELLQTYQVSDTGREVGSWEAGWGWEVAAHKLGRSNHRVRNVVVCFDPAYTALDNFGRCRRGHDIPNGLTDDAGHPQGAPLTVGAAPPQIGRCAHQVCPIQKGCFETHMRCLPFEELCLATRTHARCSLLHG